MNFKFNVNSDLLQGVKQLEENGFFTVTTDGIEVISIHSEGNVKVEGSAKKITVYHNTKSQFFYGLSFAMQNYGKDFCIERQADKRLGIMRDCARNAILSFSGAKSLISSMALLGYNYLELYIEDLMDIKEYPYLGFARGRYTADEIKSYDAYASALGIELVPAIQTLAHLPFAFSYDAFIDICDTDDILFVGEEKTYDFIEKMIEFCATNFQTKNINIGMDEAYNMFMGNYLKKHGFVEDRLPLLLEHLTKVANVCAKYGLKPAMWSDMVFKAAFGIREAVAYQNLEGKKFDAEISKTFPKDLTLIFWDYYHDKSKFYDDVFDKHFEITDNVKFAGGVWTWMGFAPSNTATERIFKAQYKSGEAHGCNDYLMTAWGDNGGECSTFMALSSFTYIAETINKGDLKTLNQRCFALFGNTYDDFKSFENVDKPFKFSKQKNRSRGAIIDTAKYALYNDPLIGKLDASISHDMKAGYKTRARQMKRLAKKNGKFAYIFESMYRLCDLLSLKATLGLEIYQAYKNGDKEALRNIIEKTIPQTLKKLNKFIEAYRTQWLMENKSFGYESNNIRFGGVKERLVETARILNEYLDGKIEKIDELERERLPISITFEKGVPVLFNSYKGASTGSIL